MHEEVEIKEHKIFSLNMLPNGNIIGFGSYFKEQDDFENDFGRTIMFWFQKITKETT